MYIRQLVPVMPECLFEEWIILKVRSGDPLPVVHDIDINIKEVSAA
jgi:hypothetical protein